MSRLASSGPEPFNACPDGGRCWHSCPLVQDDEEGKGAPCYRVLKSAPLSGYANRWPKPDKVLHLALSRAFTGFTTSDGLMARHDVPIAVRFAGVNRVMNFGVYTCMDRGLIVLPTACCSADYTDDNDDTFCSHCGEAASLYTIDIDLSRPFVYSQAKWGHIEEWLECFPSADTLLAGLALEPFIEGLDSLVRTGILTS